MATMRFPGGLKGACLAIVLALGCAPKSADEDSGTGDDGNGEDGSEGDDGGGSDLHGYAKIQLLRAANQAESPFGGTETIRALVQYGDASSQCLVEFYRANPSWWDDGLDGGPVFEEWTTKVCETQDDDESIPCADANIWQSGLENEGDTPYLNIEYNVTGAELENRVLIVGPLPTAALAGCDGDTLPTVSIRAPGITGHGADGNPTWQGTSAPEFKAHTGQGLPMKVRVARIE
jgi:hypothetical protein